MSSPLLLKPQVPAFTVPQQSEAMDVLQERARDLKIPFDIVPALDRRKLNGKELSLSGDHQLTNAGLAVALCKSWLHRTGNSEKLIQNVDTEDNLPDAFLRGLSTARLLGRAQIIQDSDGGVNGSTMGDLVFYLDGAHSPESMAACAAWFSSTVKENRNQSSTQSLSSNLRNSEEVWSNNGHLRPGQSKPDKISKNILLFNCMDIRDPQTLLPTLVDTCALSGVNFTKAIFVPSISTYSKVTSGSSTIPVGIPAKDLTWQFNLQRVWEKIIHGKDAGCKISEMQLQPRNIIHEDVSNCSLANGHHGCSAVVSSLPTTINWLRNYAKENPALRVQVLVTGSLHLVGDVLKLLRR